MDNSRGNRRGNQEWTIQTLASWAHKTMTNGVCVAHLFSFLCCVVFYNTTQKTKKMSNTDPIIRRESKRWATQTLLSEESLKDEQHGPYYQKSLKDEQHWPYYQKRV